MYMFWATIDFYRSLGQTQLTSCFTDLSQTHLRGPTEINIKIKGKTGHKFVYLKKHHHFPDFFKDQDTGGSEKQEIN